MAASIEGQDRVMAAAQHIVKSLNTSKDVTDDMILILSSFDNRLSNISDLMAKGPPEGGVDCRVDHRLEAAEKLILRWDSVADSSRHYLSFEDSPDDATEYLAAIDDIIELTDELSIHPEIEVKDRAENALQLAMSRLEDEFRHVLIRSAVPLDIDRVDGSIRRVSVSSASNVEEIEAFESFTEDDRVSGCAHERDGSLGDDLLVDLIHPHAVVELKEIADRMIRSGYEKECCQVYSSVRRDALDGCVSILGVEKLSIDEVQRIEWRSLDDIMKKWVHAVKIVVRVLLAGEKWLCEQIFSASELIKEVCFVETAKGCVMQLLNFGEAVAIGRRSSEKLFRVLDMYDVLIDVLPNFQTLFTDEYGELLSCEALGVLDGLSEAAIGTFLEFENAVRGEQSRKPVQGGEIHPLTRYVINYMKLLADYSDPLNKLLENSKDKTNYLQTDDGNNVQLECMSHIARRMLSLISSLESNLAEKTKLYEDSAMQYIFLMNNILYIVQKVKDSELRNLLGDDWIRKRQGQIRQYATSYLRASWTKVLSCLKDEGIGGSSNNVSKTTLKERFKNFNAHFEDIYRIQTGWKVPDTQLREELRISISENLIPAYRSFVGRFRNHLESGRNTGKYIKYSPEELENHLLSFFEGIPLVLHNVRRKST